MCDLFYEPSDHWSDNIGDGYDDGYSNSYSVSVDERMAAEPVTYEELEEAWNSYMEEDNIQPPLNPWETLMNHICELGLIRFNIRLPDETPWRGVILENDDVYSSLRILPQPSHNYPGYNEFNNPRDLVNFILARAEFHPLNADQDPLDFIWTTENNARSWAMIQREFNANVQ
jgi:hypothetical protein